MPSTNGIQFIAEEGRSFQGTTFVPQEMFQEFELKGNQTLQFRINLNIFMDCLSIYGTQSTFVTLQMGYGGYGSPLVLMYEVNHVSFDNENRLEESGVTTNCGLRTLEAEEVHNFNFRGSPIFNKIIMESEHMKEAFDELDWSSQHLNLLISPEQPHFRLSSSDVSGSCQVWHFHASLTFCFRWITQKIPKCSRPLSALKHNKTCTNCPSFNRQ